VSTNVLAVDDVRQVSSVFVIVWISHLNVPNEAVTRDALFPNPSPNIVTKVSPYNDPCGG
jgi:hypothetical protein